MTRLSTKKREKLLKLTAAFVLLNQYIRNRRLLIKYAVGYAMEKKLLKKSRILQPKQPRIKWSELTSDISEYKFRRMYRMTRECFHNLCKSIQDAVGIDKFRSESYLSNQNPETFSRLHHANMKRCGGY